MRYSTIAVVAVVPLLSAIVVFAASGSHDLRPKNCIDLDGLGLNATCNRSIECALGLICTIDRHCQCADGTEPAPSNVRLTAKDGRRILCAPIPNVLGQYCIDQCIAPLTCVTNQCSCPDGYQIRQQNPMLAICYKECTDDEVIDGHLGMHMCRPKCTKDEVRVGVNCLKAITLGERCESNVQCVTMFAYCGINGRCVCQKGFKSAANKACVPPKFGCRFGAPLKKNGKVISCQVRPKKFGTSSTIDFSSEINIAVAAAEPDDGASATTNSSTIPQDTCPTNSFCQTYMPFASPIGQQGHCCPTPKVSCPVGDAYADAPECRLQKCPQQTHFCYSAGETIEPLCCPKPCTHDALFHDGRCYQHVELGEECFYDIQCHRLNAKCVRGTCTCAEHAHEFVSPVSHRRQCALRCIGATQVQIGVECVDRLRIGAACHDDRLCAIGALCTAGACRCPCYMIQLADNICAAQTSCPPINFNAFTSASEPPPPPPTSATVFCRAALVNGATAPETLNLTVALAKPSCADGQFCAAYQPWFGLGVCCQQPEAVCPDGTSVDVVRNGCDPRDLDSCPDRFVCYRYLTPADKPDSLLGFVCCPALLPNMQTDSSE